MNDSVTGKKQDGDEGNFLTFKLSYLTKIYCDPCKDAGEDHEAHGFCVECQDYLCENCYNCHCVPRPTKHHQLLNKNDMPDRKVECDYMDLCHIHEGAANKYYCDIHKTCGCISCMKYDHKSCEDFINNLADIAKDFEGSYRVLDFMEWVDQTEEDLCHQEKHTEENTQTSKDSAKKAILDIDLFQKAINDKIERLKKTILKEVNNIEQEDAKKMQEIQLNIKAAKETLAKMKSDIEILKTTKQSKQLFIAMNKSEELKEMLEKQMTELKENNNVRMYVFVNDPLKNMLNNIDQIGELLILDVSDKKPISSLFYYPDYGVPTVLSLSTSEFLLADHIHNSIELIKKGEVQFTQQMSSGPWDMTVIAENKIAVTFPNERTIKVMSVKSSQMTEIQSITTDARCEGISYDDNESCLLVACTKPAEVLILGLDGIVRKRLLSTETKLRQPAYIAYHKKKRLICLTDRQKSTITIIEMNTWKTGEYTTSLKMPLSIMCAEESIIALDAKRNLIWDINLTSNTTTVKKTGMNKELLWYFCNGRMIAKKMFFICSVDESFFANGEDKQTETECSLTCKNSHASD